MKLEFPTKKFKYYNEYCCSVLVDFQIAEAEISLCENLKYWAPAIFEIKINNKKALVDLSDYNDNYSWTYNKSGWKRLSPVYPVEELDMPIFKRAVVPGVSYTDNIFPLGPYFVSDKSNSTLTKQFLNFENIYDPFNSNRVISTNRVYAQNNMTRGKALRQLDTSKLYSDIHIDNTRVGQVQFWETHANCLTSICIPGASPYTQDTAPIEGGILGACIISGDFSFKLPYNKLYEKDKHFICLNSEYSDINEKINYIYDNRQEAKDIGAEARKILKETSFPVPRVNWMAQVIEEYYG